MKKALAILATVATLGATVMSAPAEARGWRGGWGPGLAVRPWLRARSPPEPSQLARSRTIMGRATGITTTPQPTTTDPRRTLLRRAVLSPPPLAAALPLLVIQ